MVLVKILPRVQVPNMFDVSSSQTHTSNVFNFCIRDFKCWLLGPSKGGSCSGLGLPAPLNRLRNYTALEQEPTITIEVLVVNVAATSKALEIEEFPTVACWAMRRVDRAVGDGSSQVLESKQRSRKRNVNTLILRILLGICGKYSPQGAYTAVPKTHNRHGAWSQNVSATTPTTYAEGPPAIP